MTFTANTTFSLDNTQYWAQFSGASYGITDVGGNTLRFEVRAGDIWAPYDPSRVNRSEISSTQQVANGTSVHVSYGMTIEQGVNVNNSWTVLGQFHQDDYAGAPALSPPFEVSIAYGHLTMRIGYTNAAGQTEYRNVYAETTPVMTNHNYTFDINITFDPNGNGHLSVLLDGVHVVEYDGALGYASQHSVYWKEGIYRPASTDTMVVDYSNLSVTTGGSTPVPPVAENAPFSVRAYDADGLLARITTENADGSIRVLNYTHGVLATSVTTASSGIVTTLKYDSGGHVVQQVIAQTNGARTVDNYGLTPTGAGNAYTSEHLEYNAAGTLTRVVHFLSDGHVEFERTFGSNGTAIYHAYNAAGEEILRSTTYADGHREAVESYITNHTYTSEVRSYSASNVMVSLIRYHEDGSLAYSQITGVSGATTFSTYDDTGHLLRRNVVQIDGRRELFEYSPNDPITPLNHLEYDASNHLLKMTQHLSDGRTKIFHYEITGQTYTSDVYRYDAAGHLSSISRYHADGTLDSSHTYNANGSVAFDRYDATGVLTQHAVVAADGSRVVDQYHLAAPYTTAHLVYDTTGTLRHIEQVADDGAKRVSDYGILNHSYTSENTTYLSNGTVSGITRYHADKTLDYVFSRNADGSSYAANYDGLGHQTTSISTRIDGSISARAFAEGVTFTSTGLSDNFTTFGGDTLVFHAGFGADHVFGFHAGNAAGHDVLTFDRTQVADFQHLAMQQAGADVILSFNSHDTLVLHGVQLSMLTASDFMFV